VNTNSPVNAIDNVIGIIENNASFDLTSLSWSLDNALRARKVIGTLGTESIGSGRVQITGSMQAFFDSTTQIDKYLAFTTSSVAFVINTQAGAVQQYLVIDFPAIKFTSGTRVAGGVDTDVIAELAFQAFKAPTAAAPADVPEIMMKMARVSI